MVTSSVCSGIMKRHSVFFMVIQTIYGLLLLSVITVEARFGESCTTASHCTTPEETCTTDSGTGTCTCSQYYYEDTSNRNAVVCKSRIRHGETCDPESSTDADDICSGDNLSCMRSDVTRDYRCLCKAEYYRHRQKRECRLFAEVMASNLQVTNRTTSEIYLTWTAEDLNTPDISHSPVPSVAEYASLSGLTTGRILRLTPGSQYSITLETVLQGNSLYIERKRTITLPGVWTLPAKPTNVEVERTHENPVKYSISFTASKGRVVFYRMSINGETKTISGTYTAFTFTSLEPEHVYVYNLRAYNGNDDSSEPATGVISTYATGSTHGQVCYIGTLTAYCREDHTGCIQSRTLEDRCLCLYHYYRSADDTACRPLTELRVSNIEAKANATTITLTWEADTNGTKVEYEISSSTGTKVENFNVTGKSAMITELTPGTMYSFYVLSVLPPNDLYSKKTQRVSKPDVWTLPAKPGSVGDVKMVNEDPLQYEVTFLPSQGRVDHYTAMVGRESGEATDTTTKFLFRNLEPGRSYSYTVTAYSENSDASEPSTGNLETPLIATGPVSNLNVNDITTNGANVTWKKPVGSYEEVRGYTLIVRELEDSSCVYDYRVVCSDCPPLGLNASGDILDCKTRKTKRESKTVAELNSETDIFSL